MQLQIKYFGMLEEVVNRSEESLEFSGGTVDDLLFDLNTKYPDLANKEFKVAMNQEMVSNSAIINCSEIALLPPFSGG